MSLVGLVLMTIACAVPVGVSAAACLHDPAQCRLCNQTACHLAHRDPRPEKLPTARVVTPRPWWRRWGRG